jgi:type IV pilus assembly protein PilC
MDTSLPAWEALDRSLKATGNGAFIAASDGVQEVVRKGETVSDALASARLFPEEFIHIVSNAEVSGQIPEMMRHQAEYYEEEASRRLVLLTRGASFAIWVGVACLIIWVIFRIVLSYIGMIDSLAGGR